MKSCLLFLLVILIIGAAGVGGYFGFQWWANRSEFMWGVNIRPHAIGNWCEKNWGKQMKLAAGLGINAVRLTWQHDGWYEDKEDPFGFNDALYKSLKENNISIVLVIEPDPKADITNYYQAGFEDGQSIASYYKGKIKYYQMMNEGGAQSINSPTAGGQNASEYVNAKYIPVRDYMRGISEGITQADPGAVKIVSVSWTHSGFLDKIVQDDIQFDWIGVDWYDWMGPIEGKKMDAGGLYIDKLKSFNKPLVFMEVNAVPSKAAGGGQTKTVVDATKQADFITQTAEWAWANRNSAKVKGFFVLELVDNVNNDNPNSEYFGIVAATKVKKGEYDLNKPRQSYYVYQQIIKKYSK